MSDKISWANSFIKFHHYSNHYAYAHNNSSKLPSNVIRISDETLSATMGTSCSLSYEMYFLLFSRQFSLETSHFPPLHISKGRFGHLSCKELDKFVLHIIMLYKWVIDPFSPSSRTDCAKMARVVNSMNDRKFPANYPTHPPLTIFCSL